MGHCVWSVVYGPCRLLQVLTGHMLVFRRCQNGCQRDGACVLSLPHGLEAQEHLFDQLVIWTLLKPAMCSCIAGFEQCSCCLRHLSAYLYKPD